MHFARKRISQRRISLIGGWIISVLLMFIVLSACASSQTAGQTEDSSSDNEPTLAEDVDTSENNTSPAAQPTGQSSDAASASTQTANKTDRPYINRLLPEAQRIQDEYGVPVDVTLAIAIHETGWGKHTIGQNNHFGLRCSSDDCVTLNKNGTDIRYETCPKASECFNLFAESIVELSDNNPNNLRTLYRNGYATSSRWVQKVRRIRTQVKKTLDQAGIDH